MKGKKKNWTTIITAVVLVVAAGLAYSVYSFYSSGSAEKGIVVCDPKDSSKCLWQDHMHALVIISVDGPTQNLPAQTGALNKVHTHDELNVIHWHSTLPYNPVKREVLDKTDLSLLNSLASVGLQLPEGGRLFVKPDGGYWRERNEYGGYVWDDKDILFVVKDSRSSDDVLAYLNSANINLPYLGAG